MSTRTLEHPPADAGLDLMARERCDRCGAHAFVLTAHRDPSASHDIALAWCGHHFAEHAEALLTSGARVVIDVRDRLLAKRESSA